MFLIIAQDIKKIYMSNSSSLVQLQLISGQLGPIPYANDQLLGWLKSIYTNLLTGILNGICIWARQSQTIFLGP